MSVLFIEYPKCSTCKNAKKYLTGSNISFNDRNIVEETPKVNELKKWIKLSGFSINKFFNTSGMLYRSMGLKDKLKNMSDDEKINLLSSNGMLIKRPLLIKDDNVLLGFKKEEWDSILNE